MNGTTVVGYVLDSFRLVTGAGTGLTQADVRTAVGLASANLDTQLSGINTKTTNLPALPASTTNITAGTITTVGTVNLLADPGEITGPTDLASLSKMLRLWFNEAFYLTTQDSDFRYLRNTSGTIIMKMPVSNISGTQSKGKIVAP